MQALTLKFIANPSLQLVYTKFRSSSNFKGQVCVRGRTSGAYQGAGNFLWSNGVKALTLLFLEAVLQYEQQSLQINNSIVPPVLAGEKGSPAHSLALSIKKEPQWLLDMFGLNYNGQPIIRNIFCISNLYLKMGNTVSIGLNYSYLSPKNIKIICDEQKLESYSAYHSLIQKLKAQEYPEDQKELAPQLNLFSEAISI